MSGEISAHGLHANYRARLESRKGAAGSGPAKARPHASARVSLYNDSKAEGGYASDLGDGFLLHKIARIPGKLRSMVSHATTDLYVVGMPKSGNTWLRIMMGKYVQLVEGLDPAQPLPLFSGFDAMGRRLSEGGGMPRIQFTHSVMEWADPQPGDFTIPRAVAPFRNKDIVFLARAIPDVLVSLFWQHKTRVKPPYPGEISDFIRDPVHGVDNAVRFYRLWAEGRDHVKRFMLLRYEDLRRDPCTQFRALLEFFGAEVDEARIREAVEFSDFDNMRKMEKDDADKKSLRYQGSGLPVFATGDIGKTGEAFHVRKGLIGGYREYLTGGDIEFLRSRMRGLVPDWFGYPDGFEPGCAGPEDADHV